MILSHAGTQIGSGWAFGLHEAIDQIGAASGPLILAVVFYCKGGYKTGYAALAIPAVLEKRGSAYGFFNMGYGLL